MKLICPICKSILCEYGEEPTDNIEGTWMKYGIYIKCNLCGSADVKENFREYTKYTLINIKDYKKHV